MIVLILLLFSANGEFGARYWYFDSATECQARVDGFTVSPPYGFTDGAAPVAFVATCQPLTGIAK